MRIPIKSIGFYVVLLMAFDAAAAQTTVTTTGGTANQVPKMSGSSTIVNSAITESGGNVGIGITSPVSPLTISSDGGSGGVPQILIQGTTVPNKQLLFGFDTTGNYGFLQAVTQGSAYDSLVLNQSGGNVGIGTTTPGAKLEVNGNTQVDGTLALPALGASGLSICTTTGGVLTQTGCSSTLTSLNVSGNTNLGGSWMTGSLTVGGDSSLSLFGITTLAAFGNLETGSSTQLAGAGSSSVVGTWANGSQILEFSPQLGGNGVVSSYYGNLLFQTNGRANRMAITSVGNVGIGTTTPGAKLEVDGNVILTSGSGANVTFPDGTVQGTAWNGTTLGGDYAESVDVTGDRKAYEPGDVMVIDKDAPGMFLKSNTPYSKLVTGIYSTKPGLTGRRQTSNKAPSGPGIPMAMMGIVPTKVSTENGPIEVGDLLVTSSKPGYAMKGTDPARLTGAIVGKALQSLKSGEGVIEVVVSLQ